MITGKVWGSTRQLVANPSVELHALVIGPHSRCSLHRHAHKHNGFYVTSGRLYVEVQQQDYDLVDVTELGPGMFTTVPPGLLHRFSTKEEGAECLEVYYPPSLGAPDIQREDVGGRAP